MDYDEYICETERGQFTIMFQNISKLDKDHIRTIFSLFGQIRDLRCTGNETGYRFLRYGSYEEAKKALTAMEDNTAIKFMVPKRKANKSNSASKDKKSYDDDWKTKDFNDSSRDKQKSSVPVWDIEPTTLSQCTDKSFNSIAKDDENFSSTPNKKNKFNGRKKPHFENKSLQWTYNDETKQNNQSCNSMTKHDRSHSNSEHSLENTSPNKNFVNHQETLDANRSISNIKASEIDETEEIPGLVSNGNNSKIIKAKEIVVANIPTNYGAAYMLHLFESFEPLAISPIKKLPVINLRYCHVYFKSIEDSVKVESQFDKYNLEGQKLVVLRPDRLMQEAAY